MYSNTHFLNIITPLKRIALPSHLKFIKNLPIHRLIFLGMGEKCDFIVSVSFWLDYNRLLFQNTTEQIRRKTA